MICSECRRSYQGAPGEVAARGTLAGLCAACGTQPRYASFAAGFGEGLVGIVVSLEVVLIAFLSGGWETIVVFIVSALVVFLLVRATALRSEPVTFRSDEEKKSGTRVQKFVGWISGIAVGALMFWALLETL